MTKNNLIQWPMAKYWDKPWNPIIGCRPVSPACEHCYARAWAERFGQSFKPHPSKDTRPPRSGVVFCGNMTDLFGEWLTPHSSEAFISRIALRHSSAHYLWLTKRVKGLSAAMMKMQSAVDYPNIYTLNHYFGFTAENQKWYDRRRKALYHNWPTWANLWISAEPLLGPIDDMKLGNIVAGSRCRWLVVGCESGPNRRPCKIEWVESIVEQCRAANVPVFVKQICLPNGKFTNKIEEFPKHLQIRQVPWL